VPGSAGVSRLPARRHGGSRRGIAEILEGLGRAALEEVRHEDARAYFTESLALLEAIGASTDAARLRQRLAEMGE
jgi:hypothetical protein